MLSQIIFMYRIIWGTTQKYHRIKQRQQHRKKQTKRNVQTLEYTSGKTAQKLQVTGMVFHKVGMIKTT